MIKWLYEMLTGKDYETESYVKALLAAYRVEDLEYGEEHTILEDIIRNGIVKVGE